MSSAKILLIVGGLLLLNMAVGVYLLVAPGPVDTVTQSDVVNDVINDVEGPVNTVAVPVLKKGSVLDAMEAYTASSSGFTYGGESYPGMGFFVNKINGVESTSDHFWILYVNGTSSPTGVSDTRVTPGDTVEWRYEASYQ